MYFLLGFGKGVVSSFEKLRIRTDGAIALPVICTLLTEINYLNKALELFNTAMVTPTYYVLFTFATLVTDVILNQGFAASASAIVTVVFGFLVICCGITLLQMSKIDPADLEDKVHLDRRTTLLLKVANKAGHAHDEPDEKHQNLDLEDPGMDSVRGFVGLAGSVHRAISARRSIASRRKSQMSQLSAVDETGQVMVMDGRGRNGRGRKEQQQQQQQHLRTRGNEGLVRHQLYDAPMMPLPDNAAERISHYSTTTTTTTTDVKSPTRVGFDEEVVEHRYPKRGDGGEVVHQQHYPPPRGHVSSRTGGGGLDVDETGSIVTRNNTVSSEGTSSILDAYSPSPSSTLPLTPRPEPAARHYLSTTYPSRTGSSSSSSSSLFSSPIGFARPMATGGSVHRTRGPNQTFREMITDHFVASTSALNHHHDEQEQRSSSKTRHSPRSPPGTGFFSAVKGLASHRTSRDGEERSEEEERMGLVGSSSEMGHVGRADSPDEDHEKDEHEQEQPQRRPS